MSVSMSMSMSMSVTVAVPMPMAVAVPMPMAVAVATTTVVLHAASAAKSFAPMLEIRIVSARQADKVWGLVFLATANVERWRLPEESAPAPAAANRTVHGRNCVPCTPQHAFLPHDQV